MIIDCHTHLSVMSKNESFELAWQKFKQEKEKNKIDKIIIIPDNVQNDTCADYFILKNVIGGNSDIFFLGSPNIFNYTDNELENFEKLLKEKKIFGLKLFPGHDHYYPNDTRCLPIYELARKSKVPVTIHTGINSGDFDCAKYNDPKYIVEMAKKYPDLKLIIAHYFWPKLDYCFEMTKDIANIYYDTSGLADEEVLGLGGGIEKMRKMLEATVMIKPNSVIFGTDYPMCDISKHIELINSLTVSQEIKDNIFAGNALKIFNLNE